MQIEPPIEARERLLNATEQLIYAGGIHATGMDRIVRLSGVSRKSVYSYFNSKEELVAEALRRRDERWMAWFSSEVNQASTPRERLLAMFPVLRSWFSAAGFHGCAFINAAGEIGDSEGPIRKVAKLHKERLLAYVLQLCRDDGAANPTTLAAQLLILIDGAIAVSMVTANPAAADDAAAIARRLLAASV
jgi:AcrR family transcriptional regulator